MQCDPSLPSGASVNWDPSETSRCGCDPVLLNLGLWTDPYICCVALNWSFAPAEPQMPHIYVPHSPGGLWDNTWHTLTQLAEVSSSQWELPPWWCWKSEEQALCFELQITFENFGSNAPIAFSILCHRSHISVFSIHTLRTFAETLSWMFLHFALSPALGFRPLGHKDYILHVSGVNK